MRPGIRRFRSLGASLSLLALYVQVSLPMLIATELRIAEAGTGIPAHVICGSGHQPAGTPDGGAPGQPGAGDRHSRQCCPLCGAFATPYIAPVEIFVSVPTAWNAIVPHAIDVVALSSPSALTYNARAPPLNS